MPGPGGRSGPGGVGPRDRPGRRGLRRPARPDPLVLGVGHRHDHGLLVANVGRRISGTEQEIAALVHVVALLDAAPDAPDEDVVAQQHRQRRIAPELVAQGQGRHLALPQRGPVAHVGRRVRLVLGQAQLLEIPQGPRDLLLARAGLVRRRGDVDRGVRQIYAARADAVPRGVEDVPVALLDGDHRQLLFRTSLEVADLLLLMLREIDETIGRPCEGFEAPVNLGDAVLDRHEGARPRALAQAGKTSSSWSSRPLSSGVRRVSRRPKVSVSSSTPSRCRWTATVSAIGSSTQYSFTPCLP